MDTSSAYIKNLFKCKKIPFVDTDEFFEEFVNQPENQEAVQAIFQNQDKIMTNWKLKNRLLEIENLPFRLANATEGKEYQEKIDFEKLGLNDLSKAKFEGLEEIGLSFDSETNTFQGTPTQNGNLSFNLIFKLKEEDESNEVHKKSISIIINPNPKSLWKSLPSDINDIFWKEDNAEIAKKLGEKNIVAASKRGRSHQNIGGFREDDFAFQYFEKTEWSLIAVSDGAGSCSLSRKGSQLACESIIEFCTTYFEDSENQKYLHVENAISDSRAKRKLA